jgi:hypothetical protein
MVPGFRDFPDNCRKINEIQIVIIFITIFNKNETRDELDKVKRDLSGLLISFKYFGLNYNIVTFVICITKL